METECIEKGSRQSRQAWVAAFGPVPDGLYVCHACDNHRCINLDHLWLGTQKENMRDAVRKGRSGKWHLFAPNKHQETPSPHTRVYGSAHPRAKLTEDAVREIRTSNEIQADLANRFGVSQATISSIKRYYTWRHVP